MSGIGGVRAFSAGDISVDALKEMARTLRHRGPDESSVWVGPGIGLAHTRLAVVDVEGTHQPMRSADGRWVVALDGEVFNRDSLRAGLDYPFRTQGDAEVVLAGLALQGISFVERLQGHFALVAHDHLTSTTHLVRDRLGVKPLHYRHVPGGIAFASEIKALLAVGLPPQPDRRSLDAYLGTGVVPAPDTLFEGVKKVRPAHRLSIMARGHLEEAHYWTPPEPDPEGVWDPGDAIEAVGDGVREAVRAALRADAHVGVQLTGGLESGLVVAHAQQLRADGPPLHAFAAGFDDRSTEELARARRTSQLLGVEHHEVILRAADFEGLWSRLTWHLDAPVTDPADIATFGLARAAHQHVGVVLSDIGGDALFGGHARTRFARVVERSSLTTALRTRAGARPESSVEGPFSADERHRLLGSAPPPDRQATPALGIDPADRMLRRHLHTLPDHLLERADRLSMAASLQLRPALMDHRLVELALRLPTSFRMRGGAAPWLLRESARSLLPDEVIDRPRPAGRVPLGSWLRAGLRDTARARLTGQDSWVGTTLDAQVVRDLVHRHDRGARDHARLWTLLSLELWHDCFFGAAPAMPRPRRESLPDALIRRG